jgi:uncharacterized repeat protein (TIGR01451 family)
MRHVVHVEPDARWWPDPWRMALIALCTLILCSCRSAGDKCRGVSNGQPGGDSLPATAYTGPTGGYGNPYVGQDGSVPYAATAMPGMELGVPLPYSPQGPWTPPGIDKPWPQDEYVRDGGDLGRPAGPGGKNEVLGLDMEDTVAKYTTVSGRTVVQPSNDVALYAPRFGAVRQVVSPMANEERQRAGGVHEPLPALSPTTTQLVGNTKQHVQLDDRILARPAAAFRMKQGDGVMSSAIRAKEFEYGFKPYENLSIVRIGVYKEAETAFLARGSNAAIAWSHVQAVQIILDRKSAHADVKYDDSRMIYTVDEPPGNPKLRLVKVASTPFAQPGDTIDFTIRFDNVGNQPIGNVAILDSLNTRLEYVPDSAQCSVDAKFSTRPNEGGSVVVCCELAKPLQIGQGGILRFRCRVR